MSDEENALDYYSTEIAIRQRNWASEERAQIVRAQEWRALIAKAFPDDAGGLSAAFAKADPRTLISSIAGLGARGQLSFHEICGIEEAAGLAAKSCPNKIMGGMALALQAAVEPLAYEAFEKYRETRADREGIVRKLSHVTLQQALMEYPLKALSGHNRSSILPIEDIQKESGLDVTDKEMTRLAVQANRIYACSGAEGPAITVTTLGGKAYYGLLPKKLVFTY